MNYIQLLKPLFNVRLAGIQMLNSLKTTTTFRAFKLCSPLYEHCIANGTDACGIFTVHQD